MLPQIIKSHPFCPVTLSCISVHHAQAYGWLFEWREERVKGHTFVSICISSYFIIFHSCEDISVMRLKSRALDHKYLIHMILVCIWSKSSIWIWLYMFLVHLWWHFRVAVFPPPPPPPPISLYFRRNASRLICLYFEISVLASSPLGKFYPLSKFPGSTPKFSETYNSTVQL